MKNLFSLFSLVVLLGISVNVMGADTGRTPSIGSIHTYTVNANANSTFAWSVTTAADGTGTDFLDGTIVSGSSATNAITLTWLNPTAGTTYYVHVIETAANNCTNHKAYTVIPANTFELEIVSLTSAYAANAINTAADYCATDVSVLTWDGVDVSTQANSQNFNYDYGTTYLYYRVEAKGINLTTTAWKPTIGLTNTNVTGSTISTSWGTAAPTGAGPQASYTTFTAGNELTVPVATQYIYIEVAVNNNKTKDTTPGNEGTTAQAIQADLSGRDINNNAATAINGAGADNAINNIKARPNTGVIVSD